MRIGTFYGLNEVALDHCSKFHSFPHVPGEISYDHLKLPFFFLWWTTLMTHIEEVDFVL